MGVPAAVLGVEADGDGLWPMARWEAALADPARLWDEALQRVLEGESLKKFARSRGFPVLRFQEWVTESAERAGQYERALVLRADEIAVEALEISNATEEGVIVTEKADGSVETKREDMLGHRKLKIDTRMKLASKWDRNRYGDSVRVEHMREVTLNLRFGVMGKVEQLAAIEADRVEDAQVADLHQSDPEPTEQAQLTPAVTATPATPTHDWI